MGSLQDLIALFIRGVLRDTNLPGEVSDMVAANIQVQDIIRLSALSKDLNELATPVIYHSVQARLTGLEEKDGRGTVYSTVKLLRTLLRDETKAAQVRSLSLVGYPDEIWTRYDWTADEPEDCIRYPSSRVREAVPLENFTREEMRFCHDTIDDLTYYRPVGSSPMATTTAPDLALNLLSLLSSLEHLRIDSDWFRFMRFRDGLRMIVSNSGLRTIKASEFCRDLPNILHVGPEYFNMADWEEVLLVPFMTGSAKSIQTVSPVVPGEVARLRQCPVERLVLRHHQGDRSSLQSLLALTPKLQYFEYYSWVDFVFYMELSSLGEHKGQRSQIDPLFDGIEQVRETLEVLKVSDRIIQDSLNPQFAWIPGGLELIAFRQRTELTQLTKLRELEIPFVWLVGNSKDGWDEEERLPWGEVLPSSLRHLTLTDHLSEYLDDHEWSDELLLPVIRGLLGWLDGLTWNKRLLQFGLLLKRSSFNWNEPKRQELQEMCEEYGIACRIVKEKEDATRSP